MRLRGVVRWAIRAVGILVALTLILIAVVVGALGTDWGRGIVERRLEAGLNGWLHGHVEIGKLEGDLFGHPVLRDVVVTDRAGRELLNVGRIEVDVDVWDLLDHRVHVRQLVVTRPRVTARQDEHGRTDLAALVPPSEGGPSTWELDVDAIRVDEGVVTFWPYGGDVRVLEPISVRGALSADEVAVRIASLRLDVGAAHVEVQGAELARDGSRARAQLALGAPAADLAEYLDEPRWQADVAAVASVAQDGVDAPWVIWASGELAGSPFTADVELQTLPRPTLVASITLEGLEPARAWADAPPLWLALEGRVALEGRTLPELVGTVAVRARGHFEAHRIDALVLDATLDHGDVQATASAAGASPYGHGTVDVRAEGPLDDLSAVATARLADVRVGTVRVHRVDLDVDARGLPDAPTGRVRATAQQIVSGTTRISGASLTATSRDAGRRIVASLRAGSATEPFAGAADVRIVRTPQRTTIDVDRLQARTHGITWEGDQGRVTITEGRRGGSSGLAGRGAEGPLIGIALEDLALRSSAGSLTASGELDSVGDRLAVDLRGLDLAALRAAFAPTSPEVRGAIDARVVVVRRAHRLHTAEIAVTGKGLKIARAVDPFALDVSAKLAARALTSRIDVDAGRLGTFGVAVDLRTPLDPLDVPAWSKLDERDVHAVKVTLAKIDLARLADLVNVQARAPGLRGILAGEIVAKLGAEDRVTADLKVDGLQMDAFHQPVSAHLQGKLGEARSSGSLTSTLAGRPLVSGELAVDVGIDALRRGSTRTFMTVPFRGSAKIDGFPLEVLQRTWGGSYGSAGRGAEGPLIDVPFAMVGRLSAKVEASSTLANPVVELEASLSPGTRLRNVVLTKFAVTGHLDPAAVALQISAAQRAGGVLEGKLTLERDDASRARLDLRATRFDLGFLAVDDSLNQIGFREGTLDARLEVDGTRGARRADGWLEVKNARLRASELLETFHAANLRLEIAASKQLTLKLDAKVGRGGRLELAGTAALDGLALGAMTGTLRARDLAVAAPGAKAQIDATGRITGTPAGELPPPVAGRGGGARRRGPDDVYRVSVVLDKATIELPDTLGGTELHSTAPLEDVVFVDRDGKLRESKVERAPPVIRVSVRTAAPILVRGSLTRAELTAALDVMLGSATPELRGRVRVERGYVELFGRRWTVQTARVVLDGSVPADPQLDIRLTHDFSSTTVTITIRGTAKEPELKLTSDDGRYDESQLLGFVLGGNPDDETGPGGGDVNASNQAVNAASGLIMGKLQPLVRQVIPVDVVSVKQEPGGQGETLITVGKWFTRDVFVAYHHRFPDQPDEVQNANEGSLEWYFTRRWRTELLFGDRGEGSADLLWINRW